MKTSKEILENRERIRKNNFSMLASVIEELTEKMFEEGVLKYRIKLNKKIEGIFSETIRTQEFENFLDSNGFKIEEELVQIDRCESEIQWFLVVKDGI